MGYSGADGEQVADVDRLLERHRVHGDSDAAATRMANDDGPASFVHHAHDGAAVDVAETVGVGGLHDARHDDGRFFDRFASVARLISLGALLARGSG